MTMEADNRTGGHDDEKSSDSESHSDGPAISEDEANSIKQSLAADAPKTAKKAEEDGSEPSGVQSSVQQSLRADAPKTAKAFEEESGGAASSIQQALNADAPKTAYAVEAKQAKAKAA